MAGDVRTAENALVAIDPAAQHPVAVTARHAERAGVRILHRFGPSVAVTDEPLGDQVDDIREVAPGLVFGSPAAMPDDVLASLDDVGRAGLEALAMRQTKEYLEQKANRPHDDEAWDADGVIPPHGFVEEVAPPSPQDLVLQLQVPGLPSETSGRLTGSVAVGVIIVNGPTPATRFTDAERATVVAEVQNGLAWLGSQTSGPPITWSYDIRNVSINAEILAVESLVAKHSGRVLDIRGASRDRGAELIQWDANNGHNQHFILELLDDGTFRAVVEHTRLVLDVEGARTDNGARIIQWDWHGGDNQRFRRDLLGGEREDRWRNPALVALGYHSGWGSVATYISDIRRSLRTRWGYVAFFTKYPLGHFGYAGGGRVVMDYAQDGWGPANIDRVFAHETGHIFGSPDEYAVSRCECGGRFGFYRTPNDNCIRCAPGGGTGCLMRSNEWTVCEYTASHWGWTSPWALGTPLIAKHSGRALDIAGASDGNNADLTQWDWHDNNNQRFRFDPLGDGHYRIVARHSGKVLDVAHASTADGARIIQWDWHGGDNQRFRVEPLDDGQYRIVAKHSGKVFDVERGRTDNGARIIQWGWHGGDNQRFRYPGIPIVARNSGKVFDVEGFSTARGARIQQWDHHGGNNQLFRAEPVGDGYYRFVSEHSGKVFDVEGASRDDGARIIQWDWHGGDNQRFRLTPGWDGRNVIVVKHSGKVLDVEGASAANGADIQQWGRHGGENQQMRVLGASMTAKHSGLVLDVEGGGLGNGAGIIQWGWHGGDNQRFWLEALGGGDYRIVAEHSGKVLDVEGGSRDNGARLIQWDWNRGANQRFRVEPLDDGRYRLIARHSGKALDVHSGSRDNGARIIQWDWHGGDNQRFRL